MRLKSRPGNSGSSVLTCAAFSFFPPELKFRFLRNGLASGSGNCSTGPNGDGSFHAWSLLEVKRGDEHHYQCQVEHEGLAQPITVDLGEPVPPASVSSLFLLLASDSPLVLWPVPPSPPPHDKSDHDKSCCSWSSWHLTIHFCP